jgi:hypothetical protein
MVSTEDHGAWARWIVPALAFLAGAGLRYLLLNVGFPNDHFVYITAGWQMLSGDWPTRDWVDPGLPLQFLASAGAQAVLGPTLFAEGVLVSVAFGAAAALTAVVVLASTGSAALAALAALLEIVIFPRTYGYPKMLVYAAACLAIQRHAAQPGRQSRWALAAAIAIAFMFRHDHGVFVGLAAALAAWLSAEPETWTLRVRDAVKVMAASLTLLSSYAVYVAAYGGWPAYLRAGLDFSAQEAERQPHVWPSVFGADPWQSMLVYEFYAIPLVAAVVLARLQPSAERRRQMAFVAPVATMAVAITYAFVRDPLESRLPDAIVPAVVLGSWLCHQASTSAHPALTRVAAGIAAILFSVSVMRVGNPGRIYEQSDLESEWDVSLLAARVTGELRSRRPERMFPSRASLSLRPFYDYLDRCSAPQDRLLIGGYLVEVPFFAERRFAGGQPYFGGSFAGSAATETRILDRLAQQPVPFALMPSDVEEDFEREFPVVAQHVRERYSLLTDVKVTDELEVHILMDRQLRATATDVDTGWPCFSPQR